MSGAVFLLIQISACSAPQIQQSKPNFESNVLSEAKNKPVGAPAPEQSNLNSNINDTSINEQPKIKEKEFAANKVTEAKTPPPESPAETQTRAVISSKAAMRSNPTSKAKKLKTLKKGEKVTVLQQKDEWFQIERASGDVGWCHKGGLGQPIK
jgi:hypothetical protein